MMQGSLAERVRLLRARRGLSLLAASKQLGIDRHTLRRIELGTQDPQDPTLAKIAEGYGVPVEELLEEPALAGKGEAPQETGQPVEERSAHDIARDAARREFEKDLKASRRTVASEGVDPAPRISDVYEPAAYDALRRQDPGELAGTLLDIEWNVAHLEHENAGLRQMIATRDQKIVQLEAGNTRMREENARLRQDIAELRSEAEREDARR